MKFMQFFHLFPFIRGLHRQLQHFSSGAFNLINHHRNGKLKSAMNTGCQQAGIWIGAIAFSFTLLTSSLLALPAPAVAMNSTHLLSEDGQNVVAVDTSDVVEQAESQLDEAAGAGTSDRIKGRFQEGVGKLKEESGEMVDSLQQQAEGMTEQVRGRAQRDLGRSQNALEEAGETAQEESEGLIESIKNYFD